MKKTYINPVAEKLEFDYSENVMASGCTPHVIHHGDMGHGIGCHKQDPVGPIGPHHPHP